MERQAQWTKWRRPQNSIFREASEYTKPKQDPKARELKSGLTKPGIQEGSSGQIGRQNRYQKVDQSG